jgi:hypothetical protein
MVQSDTIVTCHIWSMPCLTWYRVSGLDDQPRTYAEFEQLHALFYHLGAELYHCEFDKYHIIAVSPHSKPDSFVCYKPI